MSANTLTTQNPTVRNLREGGANTRMKAAHHSHKTDTGKLMKSKNMHEMRQAITSSCTQPNHYSIICMLRRSNKSRLHKATVHNLPLRLAEIRGRQ
jgi:hypothetical protein